MADVVFVTPNLDGYATKAPVGTLLLATILNRAGIDAKVLPFYHFGDIKVFDRFIENATQKVLSHKPSIVSFYTRCDTYHISIRLAQHIKMTAPGVYIVFGGPQADIVADDTLTAIPEVDFICCGEGETTIVPFFSSLISGRPDLTTPGLAFRDGERIVHGPRPALVEDLDTLPAIDYSLLEYHAHDLPAEAYDLFPIDVGRGCPFSCTFCSTNTFWGRKYRLKSADRIISEIKEIHQRFGVTSINFVHDMFTLDRKKVFQICEKLKRIGFPLSWRCSARVDCLDRELVDAMVDAGMTSIFVGIESGSARMQKEIRKNLKLGDAVEKLSYISSKGVAITASFIFGFPNETEEDFSQTIGLMVKLRKIPRLKLQHHLFTFFSGTALTNQYMSQIQRSTAFSDITGEVAVRECEGLISRNPKLFTHFLEFKSDFRDKIKYFPQFFGCWKIRHPVYDYLAQHYYTDCYCDMLYDFSDCNWALLSVQKTYQDIMRQDRFLDKFSGDPHYAMLKEISRFLLWKNDPQGSKRDVFGFDVKALMDGAQIETIRPVLTVATVVTDANGGRKILLNTRA